MSRNMMQHEDEEQNGGGEMNGTALVVGYFAALAIAIVLLRPWHLGLAGVFVAMMGAGLVLALLIVAVRALVRRAAHAQLSARELYHLAIGYPGPDEEEDEQDTEEDDQEQPQPPRSVIEPHPLLLAPQYQPSVSSFLGATVAVVGMRRSGKSNLVAVLAEELARYGTPLVLFDTESEYSGLVDPRYLPAPVLARRTRDSLAIEEDVRPYVLTLDKEGAYAFGRAVMEAGLQVVVDLPSFADDEEAALVMSEIIDGIEDWQQALPNQERVPVCILLDESQKWFPQNREDRVVSQHIQGILDQAFYGTVVARGGKRGFGLVVAAQRYSQLNKKLLQSQHKFLFRQTEQIDLDRYGKLGIEAEETLGLAVGECFVFGPSVAGVMRVRIRERSSPHLGHTPGLEHLQRHSRRLRPVTEVLAAPYAKTTTVLAPPQHESEPEEPATPPAARRKREPTPLERALSAWNGGATSSRKVGEALGIGKDAANELLKQLERKGLIQRQQGNED